jgi:hypothetical protein
MSSNLGSMVLELSANVARFQSDMGKMYQSAQETADKITSAFERVGAVLGVGLGVGAFKEFIDGSIEAQDQALKFAQKVGISTDAVAGLSSAAKKAGVDQQELQVALTKLAVGASEAGNGVKKYAEAYSALGINVKDANGNIKAADVLFGELANKFAGYKDGTTKTADAVLLLGKAGANLIPLLNGGSDAIQRQIKLAKDLGAAIGTDAAKGAEEFKGKMIDLELVTKGVGNQIATGLLPALNKLADASVKFFTSSTWKSWLDDIKTAATSVANHLGDIIAAVKLLGEIALDYIGVRVVGSVVAATASFVQLRMATIAANSAAAAMGISFSTGIAASIKNIGLLNAALGAVGAAVAGWQIGTYLYNEFSIVQKIANNFIATLDAMWTVIKASAEGAWLYIEKAAYTMLDAVTGHLSDSLAGMAASFAKLPDALGGSKLSAQFLALSAAIAPSGKGVADLDDKIAALQVDTSKSLKIIATSWDTGAHATAAAAAATEHAGEAAKKAAPNLAGLADAQDKAAKAAQRLADAELGAQKFLDALSGKEASPFDKAMSEYASAIAEADKWVIKLTADNEPLAKVQSFLAEATALATQNFQSQTNATQIIGHVIDQANLKLDEQRHLFGLTGEALKTEIEYQRLKTESDKAMLAVMGPLTEEQQKEIDRLHDLAAAQARLAELSQIASEFGKNNYLDDLVSKLHIVQEEFKKVSDASSKAFDPEKAKLFQKEIGNIRQAMVEGIVHSSQEGLRSLQSMTKEGSQAFKALQVAIDALTVIQAISAVLNQAQGDPYTAFARMAAMAAAVVALGVDIAGFGGGSGPNSASAEVRQQTQGTGTVLGDAKAQSDSIVKATAITADATQQLVGLNRGMLIALQALQNALGAAGVQLARGAGNATFPGVGGATNAFNGFISSVDILGGDPITKALGSFLFGGSKKVIDQGIVIFGGALSEMLNGIAIGAYQTIHTSGGLFGSSSNKDQVQGVSDEFTKQFQLVIGSIADAVTQGALALGISKAQIDAAIAAFHVAEQHISLKGLSADDQQKALEAVFSSIFDGLAGAVVPFIAQFQKVGEGLGETLVRVATEVQVTQQAMKQLGLVIATTDPEKFAQIADALATAVGGIDQFISQMNSFTNHFASDQDKFNLEKDALTSAFSQVGLTLPATREGMYDLMKSLDATTDAGRAQIATLLRLSDVADAYYTALAKAGDAQAAAAAAAVQAAQQATQAFQQLIQNTQQAAAQLFGTSADQLQKKIDALMQSGNETGIWDFRSITALKKQLADQQAAQQAASQVQLATGLIGDFGSIGAQTGKSLEELAAQFNVPLDKLAEIFHTDQAGLDKQFTQAEATAKASLQIVLNTSYTNELLANQLAFMQGLPLPFTADDLNAALNPPTASATVGNKPGAHGGFTPPSLPSSVFTRATITNTASIVGTPAGHAVVVDLKPVATSIDASTKAIVDRLDRVAERMDRLERTADRFGMARRMGE